MSSNLNTPIESSQNFRIKRPNNVQNHENRKDGSFFDPLSIESESSTYNLMKPGKSHSANVSMTAPLHALSNRAKKIKKPGNLIRPNVSKQPMGVSMSSLLTKKPLMELPEPSNSIEQIKVQNEIERAEIQFDDDPIAYFTKHKEAGTGHRFLYFVYSKEPSDPDFSPYDLQKIPYCDIPIGQDYFTMSNSGVTHVDKDGNTEYSPLSQWIQEKTLFATVRQMETFKNFFYWKPFHIWKTYVMKQHYKETQIGSIKIPIFNNIQISLTNFAIQKLIQDFHNTLNEH